MHAPLVWAALRRKPAESALLLAAITCAFTLLGLMIGMRETTRQVIANSPADRVIVNPRYNAPDGLPSALAAEVRRIDGVAAVGLRNSISGRFAPDPREYVWVDAVDRSTRGVLFEEILTEEQWERLFTTRPGVYLSQRIADRLGLQSGDPLVVDSPDDPRSDGNPHWTFEVLGVVGNESLRNGNLVLGNYDYMDQQRPEASRGHGYLTVAIRPGASGDRVAMAIDRHFANAATTTASITFRAAQENMEADGLGIAVMTLGVGAAGLFMILMIVGNAIAQSVRERIPEFAVLKAIGFRDGQIARLVLLETLIPCLLGALGGMGLAKLVSLLPRNALPSALRNQTPTFSMEVWVGVSALAVVVAALGALLPVWKLRQVKVATALVSS